MSLDGLQRASRVIQPREGARVGRLLKTKGDLVRVAKGQTSV